VLYGENAECSEEGVRNLSSLETAEKAIQGSHRTALKFGIKREVDTRELTDGTSYQRRSKAETSESRSVSQGWGGGGGKEKGSGGKVRDWPTFLQGAERVKIKPAKTQGNVTTDRKRDYGLALWGWEAFAGGGGGAPRIRENSAGGRALRNTNSIVLKHSAMKRRESKGVSLTEGWGGVEKGASALCEVKGRIGLRLFLTWGKKAQRR